jgi:hypothetical protein
MGLSDQLELTTTELLSRSWTRTLINPHFPSELDIRCPEMEIML